jgi:hypothetical protein
MKSELVEYDKKLQLEQNNMFKQFEKGSQDHFEIIKEEYKQLIGG